MRLSGSGQGTVGYAPVFRPCLPVQALAAYGSVQTCRFPYQQTRRIAVSNAILRKELAYNAAIPF